MTGRRKRILYATDQHIFIERRGVTGLIGLSVCLSARLRLPHRRRDLAVELRRVGGVNTIRNYM